MWWTKQALLRHIVAALTFPVSLTAQTQPPSHHSPWQLEAAALYGRVIKHNSRFAPAILHPSIGTEWSLLRRTSGNAPWQRTHGHPWLGISVGHATLSNPSVLGQATYILPQLGLVLFQKGPLSAQFRVGVGAALLNQRYHRHQNPTNNAIGSHLNNATAFRILLRWRYSPNGAVIAGGAFTHFSNGGSTMPNLGVNIPAAYISIQQTLKFINTPPAPTTTPLSLNAPVSQWQWGIQLGMGIENTHPPGGPRYPACYLNPFAAYSTRSGGHRWLIGGVIEYQETAQRFYQYIALYPTNRQNQLHALRGSVQGGAEIRIGPLSTTLQVGLYTHQYALRPFPVYARLGVRYYLPLPIQHPQFYLSCDLKSHLVVAQYGSLSLGVLW